MSQRISGAEHVRYGIIKFRDWRQRALFKPKGQKAYLGKWGLRGPRSRGFTVALGIKVFAVVLGPGWQSRSWGTVPVAPYSLSNANFIKSLL